MQRTTMRLVLAAAAIALAAGRPARADVIIDVNQVSNDVVATGSGSIDLTGLTFVTTQMNANTGVEASLGLLTVGPASGNNADIYGGVTGPASFGTGAGVFAATGIGDAFGVAGSAGDIAVPEGYVSGAALFGNQTFASPGLTPGSYTYTWGTDSVTVQIGPARVPEPSALASVAIGVASALGHAWRRRRTRASA